MKESQKQPFSSYISKSMAEALDKIHQQTRVPKTHLLDEAIELLSQKYLKEESR